MLVFDGVVYVIIVNVSSYTKDVGVGNDVKVNEHGIEDIKASAWLYANDGNGTF